MLWSLLDLTVSHWLRGDHFWQFWLGASGGWWLGAQPFAAGLFFYGAKVLRAPARSRCWAFAKANAWKDCTVYVGFRGFLVVRMIYRDVPEGGVELGW